MGHVFLRGKQVLLGLLSSLRLGKNAPLLWALCHLRVLQLQRLFRVLSGDFPQMTLLFLLEPVFDALGSMNFASQELLGFSPVQSLCLIVSDCVEAAVGVVVRTQLCVPLLIDVAAKQNVQVISLLQVRHKLLALLGLHD